MKIQIWSHVAELRPKISKLILKRSSILQRWRGGLSGWETTDRNQRRQHGETARWCPHVVMAENLFNLCSHLLDLHFGLNSGLVGLKCCRSRLQLVTGLWLWIDRNESFIQLLWKKKTLNWNTPAEASDRKEKSVSKSHIFGGFAPLTESSIAPEDVFLMFKVFVRGTVKIREVKLHSSVQQPYKPACRIQGPWNVPRCLSSISRRD